jgi:adenylate kinase
MKTTHREIITLIGKPASGKGTQAEPLAKAMGIPYVSMGKMLREEIRNKTAIGREAAESVAAGRLVPFKLTVALIKRRLGKADAKDGIVLDGFPRQLEQAKAFEKIGHITHALLISITDKEVIHRITGRRVCPKCGRNYHVSANPPKAKGICDACGIKLMHRDDDKASVVRERLESYKDDTIPLLHYYRRLRSLRRIDGVGSIEDVGKRALHAIRESDKGIKIHEERNH